VSHDAPHAAAHRRRRRDSEAAPMTSRSLDQPRVRP
jgi:hypothetical protein